VLISNSSVIPYRECICTRDTFLKYLPAGLMSDTVNLSSIILRSSDFILLLSPLRGEEKISSDIASEVFDVQQALLCENQLG
jgi:hypothetical protein